MSQRAYLRLSDADIRHRETDLPIIDDVKTPKQFKSVMKKITFAKKGSGASFKFGSYNNWLCNCNNYGYVIAYNYENNEERFLAYYDYAGRFVKLAGPGIFNSQSINLDVTGYCRFIYKILSA